MSYFLSVSHLYFEYESAAAPLFTDLSFQLPTGWTGLVGANGAGKSTLLKLLAGKIKPDNGQVGKTGLAVLCEQEVFSPPENLHDLFTSSEAYAYRLRGNLGLDAEMAARWKTLSMGERKKVQIACALCASPDMLCLDEPTNHLDSTGRELLAAELRSFRGIGILVSHDRGLLDALCERCLFLEPGRAVMRAGNLSSGAAAAENELAARLTEQQNLQKELKRRKLELQRRREKEQQARNRDCKRKLDRHDHDGKGRIDAARVTGRDRRQGDLAGKQARKVEQAASGLAELGKIRIRQYGLKIPCGRYSSKDMLWHTAPGDVPLGGGRTLRLPELRLTSRDRIAITGSNGAGKTTLLNRVVGELKLSGGEYLYMPQELDAELTAEIHQTLKRLPRGEFSKVMNVVASLGSEPEKVLDARNCSPGEWRKLFFGLGVLRPINLIALDEPTNHLDLPSIECLEAALAECEAALLLISHDRIFLDNLCTVRWRIEQLDAQRNVLVR